MSKAGRTRHSSSALLPPFHGASETERLLPRVDNVCPTPILLPPLRVPADPLVPALQMKGRGTKPEGAHDPSLTLHQIAQLRPDQRSASQGMFPHDESIPDRVVRIVFVLNEAQAQSGNDPAPGRQLGQGRQSLAIIREAAGPLERSARLPRGQLHQPARFQPAQSRTGRTDRQLPVGIAPANCPTEFLDQLAAWRRRRPLGTSAQPLQNLAINPPSANSNATQHALKDAPAKGRCLAPIISTKGERGRAHSANVAPAITDPLRHKSNPSVTADFGRNSGGVEQ